MDSAARATPEQMQRQHVFVVNGSVEFHDVVRELLQDEHYNVTTTNFIPRTFHQIETHLDLLRSGDRRYGGVGPGRASGGRSS